MKQCTQCLETKPLDEFYLSSRGQPEALCKRCKGAQYKGRWRAKHPNVVRRSGETVWTEDKRCPNCHVNKPISEFQKHSGRSGRITSLCKECIKERCSTNFYKKRAAANLRKSTKLLLAKNPVKYKLRRMLGEAKRRAKKQSLPFNLTIDYLLSIVTTHCPVLDIPFNFSNTAVLDDSPSLDKFYPEKGYVVGNVFIISWLANVLKHKGTVDQHVRLTDWLVRTKASLDLPTVEAA